MKNLRKRNLTLLEVLIALLLLTILLPILVSSFVFTYSEQEKFLDEVVLDRVANNAFVSIFEDLFKNQIPYKDLESGRVFPISLDYSQGAKTTWKGVYAFKKLKPENPDANANYFVELYEAKLTFTHPARERSHSFIYNFILIRDLNPQQGAEPAENKEKESQAQEKSEK